MTEAQVAWARDFFLCELLPGACRRGVEDTHDKRDNGDIHRRFILVDMRA